MKKYLDDHPTDGLTVELFDFALGSKKRKTGPTPKQPVEMEAQVPEEKQVVIEPEPENEVDEEGIDCLEYISSFII